MRGGVGREGTGVRRTGVVNGKEEEGSEGKVSGIKAVWVIGGGESAGGRGSE